MFILPYYVIMAQCDPWKRNLIHNPGFEDGDNSKPVSFAQFEYVDVWEQDMKHEYYYNDERD